MQEHEPAIPLTGADAPPLGTLFDDDRIAQPRVEALLRRAEIEPCWPMPTMTVLQLVAEMGYAADMADMLRWCTDPRFAAIAPTRDANGAPLWFPRNVAAVIARLEFDRRWQPGHRDHLAKMTPVMLLAAQAEEDGRAPSEAVVDLPQYSMRDLLLLCARTEDPAVRQCIADMGLLKLAVLGWDSDAR